MQIKAIFVGESSLINQCIQIARKNAVEVLAVFSEDRTILESLDSDITHIECVHDLEQFVEKFEYDYLFSIVNPIILSKKVIQSAGKASVNYHDSLLPAYAGSHAVPWAIINGEKEVGITWHLMNGVADSGGILYQVKIPVEDYDTAKSVNSKCGFQALISFNKILKDLLRDHINPILQNRNERSFYYRYKRPSPAGLLFMEDEQERKNFVRGLSYGGTFNPITIPKVIKDNQILYVHMTSKASPGHEDQTSIFEYSVPYIPKYDVHQLQKISQPDLAKIDDEIFSKERYWMNTIRSKMLFKKAAFEIQSRDKQPDLLHIEKLTYLDISAAISNNRLKNVLVWLDAYSSVSEDAQNLGIYERYVPIEILDDTLLLEKSSLETQIDKAGHHLTFLFDLYDRVGCCDIDEPMTNILITKYPNDLHAGFDFLIHMSNSKPIQIRN